MWFDIIDVNAFVFGDDHTYSQYQIFVGVFGGSRLGRVRNQLEISQACTSMFLLNILKEKIINQIQKERYRNLILRT